MQKEIGQIVISEPLSDEHGHVFVRLPGILKLVAAQEAQLKELAGAAGELADAMIELGGGA